MAFWAMPGDRSATADSFNNPVPLPLSHQLRLRDTLIALAAFALHRVFPFVI
jgi:hypothetical protein